MSKLPSLTPRHVVKILERNDFRMRRSSGSHFIFEKPDTKRKVIVPYHTKNLPKGTPHSILKQAGISKENL